MRLPCLHYLWLTVLLILGLVLISMPKEQCYGCKRTYADLSNHLAKCKKAVDFVDVGIRRRIDHQSKKARLREAVMQRKGEEKRARAAEVKERLAARRAQLEMSPQAVVNVACRRSSWTWSRRPSRVSPTSISSPVIPCLHTGAKPLP
ncbi:hypothetical protein V8D89_008513 [Ganoderma adspersum]